MSNQVYTEPVTRDFPQFAALSVVTRDAVGIASMSIANLTQEMLKDCDVPAISGAHQIWLGTAESQGWLAPETRWCARQIADEIENLDDAIAAANWRGIGSAWRVVGACLDDPETVRAAAQEVARSAQAYREQYIDQGWPKLAKGSQPGRPDHSRRIASAAAIVAAWAHLAADTEPPGFRCSALDFPCDLSRVDLIALGNMMAEHILSLTHAAHEENLKEATAFAHPDNEDPPPGAVVVIPELGGINDKKSQRDRISEAYVKLAGKAIPRVRTPDLRAVRDVLRAEFPWCDRAIDLLLSDLATREFAWIRPSLLVGEPGGGKSRLARRMCECLGIKLARFDAGSASDSTFGGTPRRWSTSEPSFPLLSVVTSGQANPCVLIDELDKEATSHYNGRASDSMLAFFEPETASRYPDPYIQSAVDLSHVSYIATANDDTKVSAVLRDRMRLVMLQRPGAEHVPIIARTIAVDLAAQHGLDARWAAVLDGDELELAIRLWRGGSVRRLRAIIERLLAQREQTLARH